ncbi:MAG: hypothetical protein WCS15_00170 [Prevotella sp.]
MVHYITAPATVGVNQRRDTMATTYAIIETPNYYTGTLGAPQESFVKNHDIDPEGDFNADGAYDIAFFETREEAEEAIRTMEGDGPYYLSHGEAGRPNYKVVDWDKGDNEPDCYKGTGEDDGSWEEIDPDDLPEDIKHQLDSANVEFSSSKDDYDIYEWVIDGDEDDPEQCDEDGDVYSYRIVFCPRSVAIERESDDLGNINWENPGYYRSK